MPIMQKHSPAQVVSRILYNTLDKSVTEYTYVDFCAGAGGPTPCIERELNQKLAKTKPSPEHTGPPAVHVNGEPNEPVQFVMTDLHPHIAEWKEACIKSKNLTFVSKPVDTTNAPADLILDDGKKVFRMFNLAFHHFDDNLGRDILKNTLETSDGFGEHSATPTISKHWLHNQPTMEQEPDPYSYHAHPYYVLPRADLASLQPPAIPRPFRLCNVSPEERATWCMQTAYELALLKNTAFHYGDAYNKVVAAEETKLLLTNIIEMNSKGRSTLATILEAMVGLEKTVWTVFIEEEVQNELASIVRFDGHCRARLVAMNILIANIAETREIIAETEHRAMTANLRGQTWSNTGSPENFETISPESQPVEAKEEGADVFEGEMEALAGATVVEAEEEAPTYAGGSDSQHADTGKTENVAPSAATEERTPRTLRRPQFGIMSLAEAENYSSWRGSRTI
ncbi:hypothetical protein V500_00146 [Pseudogymnoascus sp. VKM F-4518 (FW-2643)]|nr:hypothetical protein V500_00146 [Pseudogymnoascus sp. VKM F-4518 (FW-2643)]